MKYLDEFRGRFKSRLSFTISDVKKTLSSLGISPAYVHVLLHHLLQKGEINRIARGVYSFREDPMVVGFAFPPFYYGLQEALSLRKMWEQETNPVVITTRKVRSGVRQFLGSNYVVKRMDRKMFFGFEMIQYYDAWVPVSDSEKTFIDFIYFRQRLPPDALAEIKTSLRPDVLRAYLKSVPPWVVKRAAKLLGRS